jgi:outer membrane lipoprotein SlyB
MANTLHTENQVHSPALDKNLAKGNDFVARFISGATVGAVAGGALTAGSGILPGALVGGLVGAVAPEAVSSLNRPHNGHKS